MASYEEYSKINIQLGATLKLVTVTTRYILSGNQHPFAITQNSVAYFVYFCSNNYQQTFESVIVSAASYKVCGGIC